MRARTVVHDKGHHLGGATHIASAAEGQVALARVLRLNCQREVRAGGVKWAGRGTAARVQPVQVEKHRSFLADTVRMETRRKSCRYS